MLAQRPAARARRLTRPRPDTPITRNQQVVAARLASGQVDFVALSSWSFLTAFLAFRRGDPLLCPAGSARSGLLPGDDPSGSLDLDLPTQDPPGHRLDQPGVIRVLVMDMGFLDGETLWNLAQSWDIDVVIPAKDTMGITREARSLCRDTDDGGWLTRGQRPGQSRQRRGRIRLVGQVSVVGVRELRSYTQYGTAAHAKTHNRKDFVGNALNAVVVTSWQGVPYPPGEEKVFLTSLPVDDPLAVLDHYRLRSLIKNTAFRELKQGWALEHFPKRTAAAVRAHVFLTRVTFTLTGTLCVSFRTTTGQSVARRGMRRWRAEEERQTVIVFAAGYYAIFDIEEVFILLGVIPAACLRTDPVTVRRKYHLPRAA